MKLLFTALGSRGDIEPFLAQAELFRAEHEIMCVFPEQFREEVEKLGYQFEGFDPAFLELLGSATGKQVMGGSGVFFTKINGYLKLMKSSMKLQQSIIDVQRNSIRSFQPDRVIFHAKCLYGFIGAFSNPAKYILLNAIPCMNHPTEDYPHIGFGKWGEFSPKWNLRSYSLINGARRIMFKKFLGTYYSDFPSKKFTPSALGKFEELELKTIYQISVHLFPKPKDWPETAVISGYLHRDQARTYQPETALQDWLKNHPKAILLTFGSMSNPRPQEISRILIDLLVEKGIPAIVNTSWGGLEKIDGSPESIFYTNHIPYDYIMPKLYGVIHHGGSGTTHLTSLFGCVQLIIPHIIDQFFWNNLVAEKNLGPKGIPVKSLDKSNLSSILDDFWTNSIYPENGKIVSNQMNTELDKETLKSYILN
ncbi:glycosyltransferase [Algoriphagus namhaensis]|uniref:Glycosyltransferase n=1 Tax=Algoriphagus namhaensis TaxID=915353 RepID=A0ABV8AWW0_9BACT